MVLTSISAFLKIVIRISSDRVGGCNAWVLHTFVTFVSMIFAVGGSSSLSNFLINIKKFTGAVYYFSMLKK